MYSSGTVHERYKTMVRCAVGEVKVEAGLHQETALSLFL